MGIERVGREIELIDNWMVAVCFGSLKVWVWFGKIWKKMSPDHFYCISRKGGGVTWSPFIKQRSHRTSEPLCEVMSNFFYHFWFPPIFLGDIHPQQSNSVILHPTTCTTQTTTHPTTHPTTWLHKPLHKTTTHTTFFFSQKKTLELSWYCTSHQNSSLQGKKKKSLKKIFFFFSTKVNVCLDLFRTMKPFFLCLNPSL